MTKHLQTIALVFAFALASSVLVRTQEKPAPPAPKPAPAAVTPLKVSVVVSRFQGEKKLSSLPYTLSVNAGSRGTLRMGAKVPVMMITAKSPVEGVPMVGPIQYQDVGTSIDCYVSTPQDDGRFKLEITIEDSSVYGDTPATTDNSLPPAIRRSARSRQATRWCCATARLRSSRRRPTRSAERS